MNKLQKFMMGRYGVDQLSQVLVVLSIILSVLNIRLDFRILRLIQTLILVIIIYRTFSKNINLRYQENLKFLKLWSPVRRKWNSLTRRIKDFKEYRYVKCSSCKQTLRVPKGKGKITITCPKCKNKMIKKT